MHFAFSSTKHCKKRRKARCMGLLQFLVYIQRLIIPTHAIGLKKGIYLQILVAPNAFRKQALQVFKLNFSKEVMIKNLGSQWSSLEKWRLKFDLLCIYMISSVIIARIDLQGVCLLKLFPQGRKPWGQQNSFAIWAIKSWYRSVLITSSGPFTQDTLDFETSTLTQILLPSPHVLTQERHATA